MNSPDIRVEVFSATSAFFLGFEINEWLRQHFPVSVVDIKFSSTHNPYSTFSAMVIYNKA